MLSILGFLTIALFTYLVMTKKMIAFTGIIFIPIVFATIGGFGTKLPGMMEEGILLVVKTAVLLLFAILYFGIMMDSGLFDPVSNKILKIAKGDPVKIAMGTAVLALLGALDGDGTTTYMIVCSAMLPIYKRLGMSPLVLATVSILSLGMIAGTTPWGGSATRAISILGLEASDYFVPFLPTLFGGAIWILFTAYVLGRRERKRIGNVLIEQVAATEMAATLESTPNINKKLLWFNFLLTVALMVTLILDVIPLYILFIIAFSIALMVNYPNLEKQKKVIKEHASNAIPVVSLVLGAGIFTGILQGTKMVDHMAGDLVSVIPDALGPYFTIIIAIIGVPLSFFMSNDAFFFGAVPVLAKAAAQYGIHPIEIGRASVIGQSIHLIGPTSAPLWVLLELIKSDLGKLQRFTIGWILLSAVVMIILALITGAISIQ
ncbi:CitMHS family transporter [Priestia megaterium]|uniref:CitMHS family transporter n=1 Tax=Priestia megaterium TaxID=1404 RepID=UPI001781AB14|nr:citrate:proton symporter [Priestia megaterium]MBD8114840.1 damage-inducible protein CinA [Priestia megaterium]